MLASTHRHGKHPRRGRRRPITASPRTERDRAKADRQAAILQAAATLFAERGYAGSRIEDLGAAVGVSGPAVYRHFPGKAAVLAAILQGAQRSPPRRRRAGPRRGARPRRRPPLASSASTSTSRSPRPTSSSCRTASSSSSIRGARHDVRTAPARATSSTGSTPSHRLRPDRAEAELRFRAHAAFGLLNSTPHSARIPGRRPADGTVRGILEEMAWASLMS